MPTDPRAELHERIAKIAQCEYEDSITTTGAVAHREFLGARIASELLNQLFPEVTTEWSIRYPGGTVNRVGTFTEAGARQRADELAAEAVYRVVGPWQSAERAEVRTAPEPIKETP